MNAQKFSEVDQLKAELIILRDELKGEVRARERLERAIVEIQDQARWYHEVWAGWNEPSVEHEIRHWLAVEIPGQVDHALEVETK